MPKSRDPDREEELLRDILLDPESEDGDAAANRQRDRAQQLQPLPGPFARVPLQWLLKPHKPSPYRPQERLFTYLLYRSHWGQRAVALTDELAAEIGIDPSTKRRIVRRLERDGWLRVSWEGRSRAMVVTMLVHSG